jgi:hypothetical protein
VRAALDQLTEPRAPSAPIPVSTTPSVATREGLGHRVEEHVDRRAAVVHGCVGGQPGLRRAGGVAEDLEVPLAGAM